MADIVQKVAAGLVAFPILFGATLACCPRQLSALQPKRRAWVLTLWSSAYLTLSAAPFVVDFLRCGGDVPAYMALVRGSPVRSLAAEWMCAVFLAFCVEDTVVGHLLGVRPSSTSCPTCNPLSELARLTPSRSAALLPR